MKLTRRTATIEMARNGGEFAPYAWPGGYPILYWCADGECLCHKCATEYAAEGFSPETPKMQRLIAMESGDAYEHDLSCYGCNAELIACYLREVPEECPEGCAKIWDTTSNRIEVDGSIWAIDDYLTAVTEARHHRGEVDRRYRNLMAETVRQLRYYGERMPFTFRDTGLWYVLGGWAETFGRTDGEVF